MCACLQACREGEWVLLTCTKLCLSNQPASVQSPEPLRKAFYLITCILSKFLWLLFVRVWILTCLTLNSPYQKQARTFFKSYLLIRYQRQGCKFFAIYIWNFLQARCSGTPPLSAGPPPPAPAPNLTTLWVEKQLTERQTCGCFMEAESSSLGGNPASHMIASRVAFERIQAVGVK